jgi:hypothetical protein
MTSVRNKDVTGSYLLDQPKRAHSLSVVSTCQTTHAGSEGIRAVRDVMPTVADPRS